MEACNVHTAILHCYLKILSIYHLDNYTFISQCTMVFFHLPSARLRVNNAIGTVYTYLNKYIFFKDPIHSN